MKGFVYLSICYGIKSGILSDTFSSIFVCHQLIMFFFQVLINHILLFNFFIVISSACDTSIKQNCFVYDDKGKKINLTPLRKANGGHYKVLSSDPTINLYINVCGEASICQKNSSACVVNENHSVKTVIDFIGSSHCYNLTFNQHSAAHPYNHVVLSYSSQSQSDKCLFGSYVTNIRFRCPDERRHKRTVDALDRNPKLISTFDCVYEIEWLTDYACPDPVLETSASSCRFNEEVHGFDLNLKSIFKKSSDFYKVKNVSINNEQHEIVLNVCGGLGNYLCGDKKWFTNAVCLESKNGQKRVIGSVDNGKLTYKDGELVLRYSSKASECKALNGNQVGESTEIKFICNETVNGIGEAQFVKFENCTYYLIWKTSQVCRKQIDDSCSVDVNGTTIDLSMLTKQKGSELWTAKTETNLPWVHHHMTGKTINLNVCDKLHANNQTLCSSNVSDSAACIFDTQTNSSLDLGKFVSPPSFNYDTKTVELIYKNGTNVNGTSITSKIIFHCYPGNLQLSPTLVYIDHENHVYEFEWKTAAACPLHSVFGNNCTVYDTVLDTTFDLTSFKDEQYYTIKNGKYQFQLNVCGEIQNSNCTSKNVLNNPKNNSVAICQIENGSTRMWSLGKANSALSYWNGMINLTYTEGSHYNDPDKTQRKSTIMFLCDPTMDKGIPEFIGESNHSYVFRWYTSLACPKLPKSIDCFWKNETHLIDLSAFSSTTSNHFAFTGKSFYFINVCRQLNSMYDNGFFKVEKCGLNSAICKKPSQENIYTNLGEVTGPLFKDDSGNINLIYRNGSPCNGTLKRIQTNIQFICDMNGDTGVPMIIEPESEDDNCFYKIQWKTAAICPIKIQTFKPDVCIFKDSRTGLSANLTELHHFSNEKPYEVFLNQTKATFMFNICGSVNLVNPICSNAAVCYKDSKGEFENFGLSESISYYFDGKDLRIKYSNGSKCSGSESELLSAEIVFKCNPNAYKSQPQIIQLHRCLAIFQWETHLTCSLNLPKCSIVNGNHYYNLHELSSITHAWNATSDKGIVYFINVCHRLPSNMNCGANAVCRCTIDNLHSINCEHGLGTPDDHELSLNDGGNLLLNYKGGDSQLCLDGLEAETMINFKCGNVIGNPSFVKETINSEQCRFEFEWTTFIACPIDQRNDSLQIINEKYLKDQRINMFLNIETLYSKSFNVTGDIRDNKDSYSYYMNFKENQFHDDDCANAAICQVKDNSHFKRDIGSILNIKYYLRGNELHIVLESSDSNKKCGKNGNKNVTSLIRLQCSSSSGLGGPSFFYESNDCDYVFIWETEEVCSYRLLDKIPENPIEPNKEKSSKRKSESFWIGSLIILFALTTITVIYYLKQRNR